MHSGYHYDNDNVIIGQGQKEKHKHSHLSILPKDNNSSFFNLAMGPCFAD